MTRNHQADALYMNAFPFAVAVVATYMIMGMTCILLAPAFALTLAVSSRLEADAANAKRRREDMVQLGSLLDAINREATAAGTSIRASIGRALSMPQSRLSAEVAGLIGKIFVRLDMGQDLGAAISQEQGHGPLSKALKPVGKAYSEGRDALVAIAEVSRNIGAERALFRERSAANIRTHLVASTVASTVLPSIAVLGFVGYAIFYYSFLALASFSLLMLAVLPALCTVLNSKLGESIGIGLA